MTIRVFSLKKEFFFFLERITVRYASIPGPYLFQIHGNYPKENKGNQSSYNQTISFKN